MRPWLTIAIQCQWFQHRLSWMLASLAQQSYPGLIMVDVAFMPKNGTPTTEDIVELYAKDLKIHPRVYTDRNTFKFRGLVRNDQLAGCTTDWILFSDSDMVYGPTFFKDLTDYLVKHKLTESPKFFRAGRQSNQREQTERLVEQVGRETHGYTFRVENAWHRAQYLQCHTMANVGAGFFQMINRHRAPHGGCYVPVGKCRDRDWDRGGSLPRSDIQFRTRIWKQAGNVKLPHDPFTLGQIHLNHQRDPEAGTHLTIQR